MKKVTITLLSLLAGAASGFAVKNFFSGKILDEKVKKIDKFKSYYNLLNQWLILKQEGKTLAKYFEENNYKSIAIYGMGEMGNRLYEELKNSSITVKYAIDKNAGNTYAELDVFEVEDELSEVDAIVVTAIFAFDEIEQELNNKVDFPILSLEDVIFES